MQKNEFEPGSSGSIELETTPFTFPVSWLIELHGRMAYLRKLAAHRRRIFKELKRLAEETPQVTYEIRKPTMLPEWLVVANCFRCRIVIQSKEQDYPNNLTKYFKDRIKEIPVIAGRREGHPFCAKCLRLQDRIARAKAKNSVQRSPT